MGPYLGVGFTAVCGDGKFANAASSLAHRTYLLWYPATVLLT